MNGNEQWRNPNKDGHSSNWRDKSANSDQSEPRHFRTNRGNNWRSKRDGSDQPDSKYFRTNAGCKPFNSTTADRVDRKNFRPSTSRGRYPRHASTSLALWGEPREPKTINAKDLLSFLEIEDTEQLILNLQDSMQGFPKLLNEDVEPDLIVLIVRILHKVFRVPNSKAILKLVNNSKFFVNLTKYILEIEFEDKTVDSLFWSEPERFWSEMLSMCKNLFQIAPNLTTDAVHKLLKAIKKSIPRIQEEHSVSVSDEILSTLESLCEVIDNIKKAKEDLEAKADDPKCVARYVLPPDNYEDISIYPNCDEITTRERGFVLNANRIYGKYSSVHEYLDVQFRLLREDFLAPLRNAICDYIENVKGDHTVVRYHRNVVFLNLECVNKNRCYKILFNANPSKYKKKVAFENSKRFMYGSLLCFTNNNFQTAIFGKVAERTVEDLENGLLTVSIETDVNQIVLNKPYLMMECSIYFEPYYQVLSVLQKMNNYRFPMERYIINVETDTQPPEYILSVDPVFYMIENKRLFPLDFPLQHSFYGMNESQMTAFRTALTNDLAIIQGPPGTGKTFVGLKIAQTLLENQKAWYGESPIMLICYTNHALDQFLEGILKYTKSVIRIGGQSKNEALQEYNIRNMKNRTMSSNTSQILSMLNELVTELKMINAWLENISQFNSIISFKVFYQIMTDHPGFPWFQNAEDSELIEWLLAGKNYCDGLKSSQVQPAQLNEQFVEDVNEVAADKNQLELENFNTRYLEIYEEKMIDLFIVNKHLESKQKKLLELKSKNSYDLTDQEINQIYNMEYEVHEVAGFYNYLKYVLGQAKGQNHSERPIDAYVYKNPLEMLPNLRWKLYFYWLDRFKKSLLKKKEELSERYRDVYDDYEELRNIDDIHTIRNTAVIGLTTTMAARMNSVLQAVKCPIVIVEEAAEVLEAHIISALTVHCQHLILIGDHQQLKPTTADYNLETKFKLGISLFERLIRNKIKCHTLNVQHRMRPEISSLIRPAIYPNLTDHESVKNRDPILGIDKSVYFIDHRFPENMDIDDTSKKNYHEAEFLMALAKHLLLNGYKDSDITILTAYLGQMYEMMHVKKRYGLHNVRIAVLDNYQGEESDIILLSLVRNNDNNSIGFLKLENRVCVAMSRARNGFYIMGNMELLCNNSEIWPKIKHTLEEQGAVGECLTLRCQIHPHKYTQVKLAEDFDKVVKGGCDLICGFEMSCGHACKSLCHVLDRVHFDVQCVELCGKPLCDSDPDHKCIKTCYRECGPCYYKVQRKLACGHNVHLECHIDPLQHKCTELLSTELPCGHLADKPCFLDIEQFRCPHPCEARVEPCGHACKRTCHINSDPDHLRYNCPEPCMKFSVGCTNQENEEHMCKNKCCEECEPCMIQMKKQRTKCVHMYQIACHVDVDSIVCKKPCKKLMDCGHPCKSECDETCGPCGIIVEKIVPDCQHLIKVKCCEEPDKKFCKQECPRILDCGHKCTKKCYEGCGMCEQQADCNVLAECGHYITKLPCWVKAKVLADTDKSYDLLSYCIEPCTTILKCEHKCIGSCSTCHQGRLHVKCEEKCKVTLICNHECPLSCKKTCQPCQKPCPFGCKHRKCPKKCGQICIPCNQPCTRKCEHQTCRKKCGELCNVPPCKEPCRKKLKCDHPCVGFCSEPCPPLCRICDKEKLTNTTLFGFEADDNARFILLEDCRHVFESRGLDKWFDMNNDEQESDKSKQIYLKGCPLCKTNIGKTARYSEYIKQTLIDFRKIKFVIQEAMPKGVFDMIQDLQGLIRSPRFISLKADLQIKLITQKKGIKCTITELESICVKIEILKQLSDVCKISYRYEKEINMILEAITKDDGDISDQEREDIELEMTRLMRMVQCDMIKHSENVSTTQDAYKLKEQIININRYSRHLDKNVLSELGKLDANHERRFSDEIRLVPAMRMSQGHWYKCPEGHIYYTTICEGAMQEANCPHC